VKKEYLTLDTKGMEMGREKRLEQLKDLWHRRNDSTEPRGGEGGIEERWSAA